MPNGEDERIELAFLAFYGGLITHARDRGGRIYEIDTLDQERVAFEAGWKAADAYIRDATGRG